MRRAEREITDNIAIDKIINSSSHCRLGLVDGDGVYIVPLNYGFEVVDSARIFYMHVATAGRKLDLIEQNNKVCIEIEGMTELITGPTACNHSMKYESVICQGTATIITDDNSVKRHALNLIMNQATGNPTWEYSDARLDGVSIIKIIVATCTAKARY